MAHPRFWRGVELVGRLRALHVAIAYGTLDAVLLGVLAPHDRWLAGWLLAAVAGLVLLAALVALTLPGMVSRDEPARWAQGVAGGLRTAALLLTAAVWGYAMWPRHTWPRRRGTAGAFPPAWPCCSRAGVPRRPPLRGPLRRRSRS